MAREGFDVYAFDGSASAVKKTERYLAEEGYTAYVTVMDGVELKYENDFFDCVIDNVAIYANLYADICRMYEEVFRVLKKGGKIYTSCFGTNTEGNMTGKYLEEGTYEDIERGALSGRAIAHFFLKEELYSTLARIGFKNIEIDSMLYTDKGMPVEMFMTRAEK